MSHESTSEEWRSPWEVATWKALIVARHERDEARREACRWMAEAEGGTPEEHAQEQGWDCFTEQTLPTNQQPRSESTSLPDNSGGNDPQDDGA